jgi:hypothetical protein
MPSDNTIRVSLRLQNDVHQALLKVAAAKGIEPTTFMQDVLEQTVIDDLPEERQRELENTKFLFAQAQTKAKQIFDGGGFTEHFTLTVIQKLMSDAETRGLYEKIIGVDAYTDGAPKKTPLNMYLGWYIKNAVNAQPILDGNGKPKRAFVKGEPIKSYTLLAAA